MEVPTYLSTYPTLPHGFNEEIRSLRARLHAQEQRLALQDARIQLQEHQQATAVANSHAQITDYLYKEVLKLYEHINQCNSKISGLELALSKSRRDIKEYARRLKHLIDQRHKDKGQTLEAVRREVAYMCHKTARGVGEVPVNETADIKNEVNEESKTLENAYKEEDWEDEEVVKEEDEAE